MHIQIEGLITFKRNYFQYQIPFFFFDKPFTDKLIHATCSRRTISKSSFSRRERKKKKNEKKARVFKYPCWQARNTARQGREGGGGGGEESEKKTNQRMMCRTSRTDAHSYVRRRDIYWGKRVRGKEERRPDEDYVICIW